MAYVPKPTKRNGQPKRAVLSRQRSTSYLATRVAGIDDPWARATVAWDALRVKVARSADPDAAWALVADELQKIGDRL